MPRARAFAVAAESLQDVHTEVARLVELPADERRLVRAQARRLTQTNCGWTTYRVAQLFLAEDAHLNRARPATTTTP